MTEAQQESIVCFDYPDCGREHAGGAGGVPVHPPKGSRISGDEPIPGYGYPEIERTDPVLSEAVRRKVEDLCHEIGRLRQELLQTEGALAVAVHEAKRWRQTAEAVGRELQGLVSRYTVADENALRVVNLLHQDAYRIGAKLLEQLAALDGAE